MISPVRPVLTIEGQELSWWGEAILNGNPCIRLFRNTIFSLSFKLKKYIIFCNFFWPPIRLTCYLSFSVNVSEICQLWTSDTILHSLYVLLLYIQGFPYSLFLSKRRHFVNIAVYNFLTSAESTLTKKWFLFMMCQITVLRVDLLGCIQPLIWLNLNGIKCLLVGPWLAYYISHFNEKHSHANTVCLEWGQMQLSWLMKAFDHSSTNWNLEKEEAIWTSICNPMNYLVHIIHKSFWRGGFMET